MSDLHPRDANAGSEKPPPRLVIVRPGDRVVNVTDAYARYQQGKTMAAVAKEFDVSTSTLSTAFREAKLPIRAGAGRPRKGEAASASPAAE